MINKGMCSGVVLKEISLFPFSPANALTPTIYRHTMNRAGKIKKKPSTSISQKDSQYILLPSFPGRKSFSGKRKVHWRHAGGIGRTRPGIANVEVKVGALQLREGGPSSQFLEVSVTISHLAPEESGLGRFREESQHSWWRQKLLCDNCPPRAQFRVN